MQNINEKIEILNIVRKLIRGNDEGVDLNRNYGYHYGSQPSEECSEDFRGPNAFSEPETMAIKKLIDEEKEITSAMNFHSYGNMWIRPFNYMTEPNLYPENFERDIINFYNNFGKEIQNVSQSLYGNDIETLNYSADGEATDWMLGEKKIIAFAPELGTFNQHAQSFFVPKDLIFEIIQENFKVVDLFLQRNSFQMIDFAFGFNNQNEFVLSFYNKGLAVIYEPLFIFENYLYNLFDDIESVVIYEGDIEIEKAQLVSSEVNPRKFTLSLTKIKRLSEFTLKIKYHTQEKRLGKFDTRLLIAMKDGF